MLKRVLFLIAAMLLLDARAWAEPDALAQRVKRVGVLVLVDDQLELARVGILVFGNKRAMIETPLGMLADIAYEVIETELGKEERYQVRRVEMADSDRRRLAAIGYEQSKGFFGPSLGPLAGQIAPHLQRCECDALLVVTTGDGITDPNSNQRFRGFAWVGLGSDAVSRTQVTSTLYIYLIDPASGRTIDVERNATLEGTILVGRMTSDSLWPRTMDAIPAEVWPELRRSFASQLFASLRSPLFELGLRPSCTQIIHNIRYPVPRHRASTHEAERPLPPMPPGSDPQRC